MQLRVFFLHSSSINSVSTSKIIEYLYLLAEPDYRTGGGADRFRSNVFEALSQQGPIL